VQTSRWDQLLFVIPKVRRGESSTTGLGTITHGCPERVRLWNDHDRLEDGRCFVISPSPLGYSEAVDPGVFWGRILEAYVFGSQKAGKDQPYLRRYNLNTETPYRTKGKIIPTTVTPKSSDSGS